MNNITSVLFMWQNDEAISNDKLAELLNINSQTLSAYKSRGLPKKLWLKAEQIIDTYGKKLNEKDPNRVYVEFADDEFDQVSTASLRVGTEIRDFMKRAIIARARDELATQKQPANIIQFELEIPAYLSAGYGTDSDASDEVIVCEKKYPNSYKGARVQGDSMDDGSANAIPDGSIAVLDTEWSGKPYPAKNKIYAWNTEEGNKLKKFVRCKVDGKTRGILESLNPEYPPIPYEEHMMPQGEFVEVLK